MGFITHPLKLAVGTTPNRIPQAKLILLSRRPFTFATRGIVPTSPPSVGIYRYTSLGKGGLGRVRKMNKLKYSVYYKHHHRHYLDSKLYGVCSPARLCNYFPSVDTFLRWLFLPWPRLVTCRRPMFSPCFGHGVSLCCVRRGTLGYPPLRRVALVGQSRLALNRL